MTVSTGRNEAGGVPDVLFISKIENHSAVVDYTAMRLECCRELRSLGSFYICFNDPPVLFYRIDYQFGGHNLITIRLSLLIFLS